VRTVTYGGATRAGVQERGIAVRRGTTSRFGVIFHSDCHCLTANNFGKLN
jgi:hypothetical protein